jgi:hypothetical protein
MSNELLLMGATTIGLAAIAMVVRRFMILDDPTAALPQRIRLAVQDAVPPVDASRGASTRSTAP